MNKTNYQQDFFQLRQNSSWPGQDWTLQAINKINHQLITKLNKYTNTQQVLDNIYTPSLKLQWCIGTQDTTHDVRVTSTHNSKEKQAFVFYLCKSNTQVHRGDSLPWEMLFTVVCETVLAIQTFLQAEMTTSRMHTMFSKNIILHTEDNLQ